MRVLPSFRGLAPDFIVLGHTLTCIPMWQPFIKEKLCSWIALFMYPDESWEVAEKYNSVLSQLWNPDPGEYVFIDESERALGLTFIALSNFWEDLNLIDSGAWDELVLMLRCTGWAVLRSSCDEFGDSVSLAPPFFTAFSGPLHDSLARAGAAMKNLDLTGNNTSNGQGSIRTPRRDHGRHSKQNAAFSGRCREGLVRVKISVR